MPRLHRSLEDPDRPGLCFEEWRTVLPGQRTRAVRAGRRWLMIDPPPPGDWRAGVASTLAPGSEVLFVGVGSWFEPSGAWDWSIHEVDSGVRKLAARGFDWGEHRLVESPVSGSWGPSRAGPPGCHGRNPARYAA